MLQLEHKIQRFKSGGRVQIDVAGAYFKAAPDMLLNATVGNDGMEVSSDVTFLDQCQLLEAFRIQIQPGDILGLEIPPTDNESFDAFYTWRTNKLCVNYSLQSSL